MKYAPVCLIPTLPAKMVSSDEGVVSGVASEKLPKGQSLDIKQEATESNEEVSALSITSHKTQGQSLDIKQEAMESNEEVGALSITPHKTPQGLATADGALQSDNRHISSVKPERGPETSYSSGLTSLPCEEVRTPLMTPEKAPQKPDSSLHTLQSFQEGSNPSVVREKRLDDGYNWRKYGQKNVKGNEYIRSYYKCTYPNCQVKRQVERSHDGQITDTIYFGEHDHPKPQANLPQAVGFVVSIVENRSAAPSEAIANDKFNMHRKTPSQVVHPTVAESDDVKSELLQWVNRRRDEADNNDAPNSKRQKKDNLDANPVGKSGGEQRLVVKTMSEVDAVSDGYRWRKYGQKLVKGNPNPRSYYRCSSPGCLVKKHVERASHDPKMVVATYEGQHDHDTPPCRTVTYTIVEQNKQKSAQDEEHGTESGENKEVCLDKVVHKSSDPHSTPPPPPGRIIAHDTVGENNQAGESGTKTREDNAVCLDKVVHRSSDSQGILLGKNLSQSTVGDNTKTTAHDGEFVPQRKENDIICVDMGIHKSPHAVNKPDEQLKCELGIKSEVCNTVSSCIAVHSGFVLEVNQANLRTSFQMTNLKKTTLLVLRADHLGY